MLWLYRTLTLLLAPWALWRLHGRAPAPFKRRWRERLGRMAAVEPGGLWIHAASVGEVNAGKALIDTLLAHRTSIIVSTVTVTGAERVQQLFGDRVTHRFLPLDTRGSTLRWLESVRPRLALVLETELWPVLYRTAAERQIPLALINARVSEKSLRRYRFVRKWVAGTLAHARLIACQSRADAERFRALGASPGQMQVTGNLKFDIELPRALPAQARALRDGWGDRPVWVAGSTHAGEEEQLLIAHARVREIVPDALLVLAPRHPERSAAVARTIAAANLSCARIGEAAAPAAVVLVDRIGELMACYAAGDIVFVGGSLVAVGGHNLLEPASLKRPVISGPHLGAQREIAGAMEQAGALIRIIDAVTLGDEVLKLFRDADQQTVLGETALAFVESGRGALGRTLALIGELDPTLV